MEKNAFQALKKYIVFLTIVLSGPGAQEMLFFLFLGQ